MSDNAEASKKKKVLLYGDSPFATTGLGKFHKVLCDALVAEGYDVTIVALNNFNLWYDYNKFPCKILDISKSNDPVWGTTVMKMMLSESGEKWDLIITSHDLNRIVPFIDMIAKRQQAHNTKWINIGPVDRKFVSKIEAKLFELPDVSLVYSDHAVKCIKEHNRDSKVKRMYLPVDTEVLYPIEDGQMIRDFRKQYFGVDNDKVFIVANINRNINRKDIGMTIHCFGNLALKEKRTVLYLHSSRKDSGGDFSNFVEVEGISPERVICPDLENAPAGVPDDVMNLIYNSVDLVVSTSRGEGYGYSTVEALATKTPFLGPNNTSFPELLKNGEFGYLSKIQGWIYDYALNSGVVKWEVIDPDDFKKQLEYILRNKQEAKEKAVKGYEWVKANVSKEVIVNEFMNTVKEVLI